MTAIILTLFAIKEGFMSQEIPGAVKFEELVELISSLPDDVSLTVIGGQALSFWVLYYQESYPEKFNAENIIIGTVDIDFLTDKRSMSICADAWGVKLCIPDPSNVVTPQIGLLEMQLNEKPVIIDFLTDYVKPKRIKDGWLKTIPLSEEREFYILGPQATLLSKIGNVIVLKRKDENSIGQLRAAMMVIHCAILESIDNGEKRSARRLIKFVLSISRSPRIDKPLCKLDVDLLEIIPNQLNMLDIRYVEQSVDPEMQRIQGARN